MHQETFLDFEPTNCCGMDNDLVCYIHHDVADHHRFERAVYSYISVETFSNPTLMMHRESKSPTILRQNFMSNL